MAEPVHNKSLSVVIPMYEEVENAAPLLARVHEGLKDYPGAWELILVDDGSTDGTPRVLREEARNYGKHVRVVQLRRNFGQTAAMQAGIDAARGELIATLDGDLQNDPADIPAMVEQLLERDLDLLQGWRRERQDNWLRKFPSRIANRLIGRVTGVRLHDYGCSLKIYRAEVLKQVQLFGEMHRFIPVWVASVTSPARIGETEVRHYARTAGQSKYGISRTFRVILDLLAVFFFLNSAPAGAFLRLDRLGVRLHRQAHHGFAGGGEVRPRRGHGYKALFFIGILLVVASIQFLTTGMLAEMVSRTFFGSSATGSPHSIASSDEGYDDGWHPAGKPDASPGRLRVNRKPLDQYLLSGFFVALALLITFYLCLGFVPLLDLDEGRSRSHPGDASPRLVPDGLSG